MLYTCTVWSQKRQRDTEPKLILDIPIIDVPYLGYSIQSRANHRNQVSATESANIKIGDYLGILESPSMYQVMGYTTSFYNTVNYSIAKTWNKWKDPSKSKSSRIWNSIFKEFSAAIVFAATTKVPFAGGWAHEEFHRNTWAQYDIGSYNEIWNWNLSPDALSYVSHLRDEDLVWFKANDPAGFVRMGSAGIEAHFLTNELLQTQDFLYNTNLPNIALYWADVIASSDYVNRASTTKTIEEHSEIYDSEENVLKRDFTGNDFTGWVYDLFRPNEPYEDRGIHPTGIGIDRYRTYNDLTPQMLDYVERMGNRQWLNLISPFMIGIREFRINENLSANFAIRHYLTPFGDDIQVELYARFNDIKSQIVLHNYANFNNQFKGLEVRIFDQPLYIGKLQRLVTNGRLMLWNQPKNQLFRTNKNSFGGLASMDVRYKMKNNWHPYMNFEAKTNGWVAGNPYLDDRFSVRIGLQASF
ncbi:MAG: hypothetical protein AAFY41_02090 [Bacteroidota bacterium]